MLYFRHFLKTKLPNKLLQCPSGIRKRIQDDSYLDDFMQLNYHKGIDWQHARDKDDDYDYDESRGLIDLFSLKSPKRHKNI